MKKKGGGNEMIGVTETAILGKWTITHAYNLVKLGRFAGAERVDGRWRIPRKSVVDYIQGRKERTQKLAA